MDAVICPGCGRRIRELAELREVYQVGASLRGRCQCGCRFGVGRLWKVTRREKLNRAVLSDAIGNRQ